jgi:hypothetical protein
MAVNVLRYRERNGFFFVIPEVECKLNLCCSLIVWSCYFMVAAGLLEKECALQRVKNKHCMTVLVVEGEAVSVLM